MNLIQILGLAIVQGLAEMLPVSSSAHVILAEKLMGLDPSAPEMTFLLVMLHTGTMVAALVYFGKRWLRLALPPAAEAPGGDRFHFIKMIIFATAATGVVGLGLKILLEKVLMEKILGHTHGEVEHLFKNLPMISAALFAVGCLIIYAGTHEARAKDRVLTRAHALVIGVIQGLCLPFRGFSRSGATISTGLFMGVQRTLAEEFSFALAVVLTPPVIVMELHRLLKAARLMPNPPHFVELVLPGLLGMMFSFAAALVALKWLSAWLEHGRWKFFGYYCLAFSAVVFVASTML